MMSVQFDEEMHGSRKKIEGGQKYGPYIKYLIKH